MVFVSNSLRNALLAAGLLTGSAAGMATSATVNTALYLNIDSSGSISSSDYALQTNAYESLLSTIDTDGSLAIGVLQFSSSIQEVFPLQQISSAADRTALTTALGGMSQLNGNTNIAAPIDTAAAALTGFGIDCASASVNCLIDVSTDGQHNLAGNPVVSAVNAVAAGVDAVNCLGVGSANCNFVAGSEGFSITVDSFADFRSALNEKLALEGVVTPGPMMPPSMMPSDPSTPAPIPLPAPAVLLLAGLASLLGLRRARRAMV